MRVLRIVTWLLALALAPLTATAYGPTGHEMVGAIADHLLGPHAKAEVKKIIGMPLRVAATWPDCVRDVAAKGSGFVYVPDPRFHAGCAAFETAAGKARMVAYASRNWTNCPEAASVKGCHTLYHFADVAVPHDSYDRSLAGTSDHDIVSAALAAIAKLQGQPVPPPIVLADSREALLLLTHLLGDLHQPLHVGALYLDANNQPVDPGPSGVPVDPKIETRGGNQLEDGSSNLHSDWDAVSSLLNPLKLPPAMLTAARQVAPTPGALSSWPAAWASDTLHLAPPAFQGLSFTHGGALKAGDWVTAFPDHAAYIQAKVTVQNQQLVRGGARLAQLLNAIWP